MSTTTGNAASNAARAKPLITLREFGVTPVFIGVLVILSVFSQLGFLTFILLMKHIADGVTDTGNVSTFFGFGLLFAFTTIVSAIYTHIRSKLLRSVAERLGLKLRAVAMQAAIRNAVRTDTTSGVNVLRDINRVQRFFASGGPVVMLDLTGGAVALALLFYLDTGLGLIGVTAVCISLLLGAIMLRVTARKTADAEAEMNETSADLSGQLAHPDLVRGMGLLGAALFRWQGRYDTALNSQAASAERTEAMQHLEDYTSSLSTAVAFGYCCFLVIHHLGTMGLLLGAFFLMSQATSSLSTLFSAWGIWTDGSSGWRRLQRTLVTDAEPTPLAPDQTAPAGLLIEDVTFWPPKREKPIVGGVSLTLSPGTACIVQGPNGVGKSTLLRLTLGLLQPTQGRVLLNGQDTFFCDRSQLGGRVGYLPQDVQLLEGDVFANIGRGPGGAPDAVVAAARAAGAHDMIGRLPMGYQTPAGNSSGLSAGQRRLIGLARALYQDPDLLVLDEPEVGLDGPSRAAMRSAVERTRLRGGVVLIVTHEPRTWLDVTDFRLLLGPRGIWQLQPAHRDAETKDTRLAAIG
jgi:ATP-binding cassette subfamily C protein